jgi:3-dehydroquinate synthase
MRMKAIAVELGDRSYEVRIAAGLLDEAGSHLAPFARQGRLVVISDSEVWTAQGRRLEQSLAGISLLPIIVEPGEGSKSWRVLAEVVDRLVALDVERTDHIVAFGGGVVGDLAGFAAAIVKRGCNFVQIPTTLLAQVDSSVGGKTGINVPAGKNLVGAFHQPALVLIDPDCLRTLDPRQVRAGYAEVVKYGLIDDPAFFEWLDVNYQAVLSLDPGQLIHAIATSVASKARIVAADEKESSGTRALLNLGHTFGHALEAESGFSDRLLHGEAVALGCVLAMAYSAERGLCSARDAERVRRHFAEAGLPVSLGELGLNGAGERLAAHMAHDKKKSAGRVAFILSRGIGQAFVSRDVELAQVADFLDRQD